MTTEHDFDRGVGGFWIKPDGTSIPVTDRCGHSATLNTLHREDRTNPGYYSDAYKAGWARVSTSDYSNREFHCTWGITASRRTLAALAAIIRHKRSVHQDWWGEVMRDTDPVWLATPDRFSIPQHDPRWPAVRFTEDGGADKLASVVMRCALIAAKAEKAAMHQAELVAA